MDDQLSLVQFLAVAALPLLFAITVHEVAHGWMARRLGDPTAMMLGRLSLNPLKHIDPIGTVVVPVILMMVGGFIFGWAKPVPVTWENLRHPKRDMALVAVAGPMANLVMAVGWALLARAGLMLVHDMAWLGTPLILMGHYGVFINLVLMVLNLLPLPPLDGGRIAAALLPGPWAYRFSQIEPYGVIILVLLLATQVLGRIIGPPIDLLQSLIMSVFGL